jgi:hypothetical protein
MLVPERLNLAQLRYMDCTWLLQVLFLTEDGQPSGTAASQQAPRDPFKPMQQNWAEGNTSSSPVSKPQRPNKSRKGKKQGSSRKPHNG